MADLKLTLEQEGVFAYLSNHIRSYSLDEIVRHLAITEGQARSALNRLIKLKLVQAEGKPGTGFYAGTTVNDYRAIRNRGVLDTIRKKRFAKKVRERFEIPTLKEALPKRFHHLLK
jgi:predicted transcriptional regulator